MNIKNIDLVLQYALAVAGERDGYGYDRELGPIHLVKYVYLADLAYAAQHEGETFTGAPWRFHHYGPWSPEVWDRIIPALRAIGANERHFTSQYKDDAVRWSASEPALMEALGGRLPFEVASSVRRAVNEFGGNTAPLLQEAYTTPPMLQTAPGEMLDFAAVLDAPRAPVSPPPLLKPISKTQLGKLRKRVQERLEALRGAEAERLVQPKPRYDENFARGTAWLDSLAGDDLEEESGEVLVSDHVWTSYARRAPKLP